MKTRALVLGINGQDGIFLSRLLLSKSITVFGIGRQQSRNPLLSSDVKYSCIDICDTSSVAELIRRHQISQVYNLAGISSVAYSFKNVDETYEVNYHAVIRLLNDLKRELDQGLRFYQASSSEMFGETDTNPQDENSLFNPVSPYADSKVGVHLYARNLRDSGYFVCSGILFNHESIYRPETFVTRKISSGMARISLGLQEKIQLGNLVAERDWGFAGDYMNAVFLMLNSSKADEFIVATGLKHSIKDIVELSKRALGMETPLEKILELDSALTRPKDVRCLIGNSEKCRSILGWKPTKTFEEMITEMARHDYETLSNGYHKSNS